MIRRLKTELEIQKKVNTNIIGFIVFTKSFLNILYTVYIIFSMNFLKIFKNLYYCNLCGDQP